MRRINRPVFRAGPAGSLISPNFAGRLTADFALCFQIFKSSNSTYANQCLLSAEHIFALANTNPSGNLLTVAPYSFYPETEWRDDLEFGATELYFAVASGKLPAGLPHTDPLFYLQSAAHWAHAYITGPNDAADTLNLYDVSAAAHYELYHAIAQAGNPGGLEVTQADLLSDLKKQLDKAVAQAGTDPFGFGFPWATFDTTSHGAGLVVMASEYDHPPAPMPMRTTVSNGRPISWGRTPGEYHSLSVTARPSRTACSTRSRISPVHLTDRRQFSQVQ